MQSINHEMHKTPENKDNTLLLTFELSLQIIRLEGQVSRYKTASESAEKVEDELKVEKRKLQREVRCPLALSLYQVYCLLSLYLSAIHSPRYL